MSAQPSNEVLARAATLLEGLASDLRGEAEKLERVGDDTSKGKRREADELDEVASWLDDVRGGYA